MKSLRLFPRIHFLKGMVNDGCDLPLSVCGTDIPFIQILLSHRRLKRTGPYISRITFQNLKSPKGLINKNLEANNIDRWKFIVPNWSFFIYRQPYRTGIL